MPNDPQQAPRADFDLDEDLFDFEDVAGSSSLTDYDLDEIFASFEEAEQQAADEAKRAEETAAKPQPEPPAPLPKQAARSAAKASPMASATKSAGPKGTPTKNAPEPAASKTADTVVEDANEHGTDTEPTPATESSRPALPRRPVAPTPAPADPVGTRGFGGKGMVWALVLIGSLNALVALVVVQSMLSMRGELAEVGNEVTDSTRAVLEDVRRSVDTLGADPLPEVPPNPEEHPTFEAAREEITSGQYAQARQRLYALLAIIDRFDPVTRAEVEARANYLLAEAVHLEAVEALSEARR